MDLAFGCFPQVANSIQDRALVVPVYFLMHGAMILRVPKTLKQYAASIVEILLIR